MVRINPISFAVIVLSLSLLVGCGMSTAHPDVAQVQTLRLSGNLHGGQQPITGASVFLYGIAGYQGAGSNSLLSTSSSGVSTDGSGNGYVTTDANGDFLITGDYTCPSYNTAIQTYLLAVGGNPGLASGTNNTAITLIAALGNCSSLTSQTFIDINEVSTVAAVTALQQFMTDATHVSTGPNANGSLNLQNPTGIANAFLTVPNLVDQSTGTALLSTASGQGTAPQAKLNSLANILASCVNSVGPSSTPCAALFAASTPSGGTAATDIVGAMLQIAHNPSNNVSTLYALTTPTAPFSPSLNSAPNDWTLSIAYSGGGLVQPRALAVDNYGDVFTANCATCVNSSGTDSIVGYSANGTALTGASGYTAHIHKPTSLALDLYDNIWTTNLATGSTPDEVNRTDSSGNELSGFPVSDTSINSPQSIAVDGNYYGYVANKGSNSITKVYGPGTITGVYSQSGFTAPTSVALDGYGNLFAAGSGSSTIFEMTTGGTIEAGAGYTGGGISSPAGIAVDGGDHVWAVNGNSTASEIFGYNGTADSGTGGYSGINQASAISIAGDGSAWIGNCRSSCSGSGSTAADNVVHLSSTGTVLSGSGGYQDSSLATPAATIIDPSGNLWIANTTGASLTEMIGVASPVIPNLTYEAANNLLPSAQLLLNQGFELAGTGTYVPDWTATSGGSSNYTEGNAHSGQNRLTQYSGSPYNDIESQALTLTNGNYLVSCFATGSGGQTTASLYVSGYNSSGSTLSVNLLTASSPLNSGWTLYSLSDVPVSNGSLTVNLSSSSTSGGQYMSWDDCSVTKE